MILFLKNKNKRNRLIEFMIHDKESWRRGDHLTPPKLDRKRYDILRIWCIVVCSMFLIFLLFFFLRKNAKNATTQYHKLTPHNSQLNHTNLTYSPS